MACSWRTQDARPLPNGDGPWPTVWQATLQRVPSRPGSSPSPATGGAWRHDAVHGDARLSFAAQSLQGAFLGSPHGVMVHNLPLRGSSGTLFDKTLEEDWEVLDRAPPPFHGPPAIWGERGARHRLAERGARYAQRLGQNIEHIQRRCPGAAIVFVGPSDMGQTSEDFPALTHRGASFEGPHPVQQAPSIGTFKRPWAAKAPWQVGSTRVGLRRPRPLHKARRRGSRATVMERALRTWLA